jgi:tRNA threonylcarbamoyl adenosine modification protein YeaZ
MVLVIDTSSACSGLALLRPAGTSWEPAGEVVFPSGRGEELADRAGRLIAPGELSGVAVALGPGSFTGLRVGVSYGLGLALGRAIPLYGLGTLALAAARSRQAATGLSEAGRGRVYFLPPGGEPGHGGPGEVPRQWPAAGWLRPATAEALRQAGVRLLAGKDLEAFAVGAARAMERAERLRYGSVSLRYMSSVGRLGR